MHIYVSVCCDLVINSIQRSLLQFEKQRGDRPPFHRLLWWLGKGISLPTGRNVQLKLGLRVLRDRNQAQVAH